MKLIERKVWAKNKIICNRHINVNSPDKRRRKFNNVQLCESGKGESRLPRGSTHRGAEDQGWFPWASEGCGEESRAQKKAKGAMNPVAGYILTKQDVHTNCGTGLRSRD